MVPELYTTVKNISGVTKSFSFLPPHGVRLAPNATYTFFGNITDLGGAAGQEPASRRRTHKALQSALQNGVLEIVQTSQPILHDAGLDAPRVLTLSNGTIIPINPSTVVNLLTNGTFASDTAWTKGTGWTIGAGVATKAAGDATALAQAEALVAGRKYLLTYTMTRSAGTLTPGFTGTTPVNGTARSAAGTYVEVLTAVTGNNSFQFAADASFIGTVDNVSLILLSQDL